VAPPVEQFTIRGLTKAFKMMYKSQDDSNISSFLCVVPKIVLFCQNILLILSMMCRRLSEFWVVN